jgi:hypothetical protein
LSDVRVTASSALGEFQALEFDAIGSNLGEVIVRLLGKPSCSVAAKNFRKTHCHLRRDATLLVDQFRQGCARNSEGSGGLGNGEAQGFDALPQYEAKIMHLTQGRHTGTIVHDDFGLFFSFELFKAF